MVLKQIGRFSFVAGLIIVLLTGLFAIPMVTVWLFGIGLIVGFLNIKVKEAEKFLVATIALTVLGVASIQALSILGANIGTAFDTIFASLIIFAGTSSLVVAIKTIIEVAE